MSPVCLPAVDDRGLGCALRFRSETERSEQHVQIGRRSRASHGETVGRIAGIIRRDVSFRTRHASAPARYRPQSSQAVNGQRADVDHFDRRATKQALKQ